MEEKVVDFLKTTFFDEEESEKFIQEYGECRYISVGIQKLEEEVYINAGDNLRKAISIGIKRIISVREYENLKKHGLMF